MRTVNKNVQVLELHDHVGECKRGSLSYCGYLFAQGGIIEGTHNFLQEIGNLFDKSGCVLCKSSCVCLASEQGLWDVSSLMRTLYQELLFFLSFV